MSRRHYPHVIWETGRENPRWRHSFKWGDIGNCLAGLLYNQWAVTDMPQPEYSELRGRFRMGWPQIWDGLLYIGIEDLYAVRTANAIEGNDPSAELETLIAVVEKLIQKGRNPVVGLEGL